MAKSVTAPLRLQEPQGEFSPAMWDALTATIHWKDMLSRLPANQYQPALHLLATLASRDLTLIESELGRVGNGPMAHGAKLLALVDLGRYAEVMNHNDHHPAGFTTIDLFDAANINFAVAMAASMCNRMELSATAFHTARQFTEALGMRHRLQLLQLEMERVEVSLGHPNPTSIIRIMKLLPMSERRERHAQGILAEAYLELGDYVTAKAQAPKGSDIQGFAAALLGETILTYSDGENLPLARAVMDSSLPVPAAPYVPFTIYGELLTVMRAQGAGEGTLETLPLLKTIKPVGFDQKIIAGLLRLAAITDLPGIYPFEASEALMLIEDGLSNLVTTQHLAAFLQRQAPRLYMLLVYLPESLGINAGITRNLTRTPMWAGNVVRVNGVSHNLPGETGSVVLARRVQGLKARTLHPQELKRYRAAWEKIGVRPDEAVQVSWLLQALFHVADSSSLSLRPVIKGNSEQLMSFIKGAELKQLLSQLIEKHFTQ